MAFFVNQLLSNDHAERCVHVQHGDRHPTDRRSSHENRPVPTEVPIPFVASRMKQSHEAASRLKAIDSGEVWPLVTIAVEARVSQVPRRCRTTMLLGDDVFNLKRAGMPCVGESAVFASASRPLPYLISKRLIHDEPLRRRLVSIAAAPSIAGAPTDRPRG